ncbi:MAG: hypothetical protein K6E36_09885 [Oscillospiraceae bacterium]|nr:hypothetical protein [Oscillospiraceae bacterium]
MKKLAMISAAALAAAAVAVPASASAADGVIYGTMNIPYTEFYAAEMGSSAGEVDAVTSATKNKVLRNGEGEMFEGSYNNGEDTILGVTYPVAVTQADLDALGTNNYGFTKLDAEPEAYKTVTVSGGKASFSAVQDKSPETASLGVKLSTETPWGDYLIDLTEQPEGFDTKYRGALLKTADGKAYAMRHEQNIWRGELAWSSGIKTEEPHGNKLDYKMYEGLMGSTVKEIVLITKSGYVTVKTDTYIPVKFAGSLTAENGEAGTGSTTFAAEGIPADYQKKYKAADGFTVTEGKINYTGAKPGSYQLTVSDAAGKYAPLSTSFVLETDALPVQFKDGKLVKADGASDADAENFIRNLSKVEVGEKAYNASGRGAVKIFDETGAINFDAESRDGKVFADGADGTYTLNITATGYRKPLAVQLPQEEAETTAAADQSAGETTETQAEQPAQGGGNSAGASDGKVSAPKAGDAGMGLFAALASAGVLSAALTRRKRRS